MIKAVASEEKLGTLRAWMRRAGSVAVAYSGGVDSTLVLRVAVDELGGRALGVLAVSPSLPAREKAEALELAASMGARLEVIATGETADPRYQANPANRCLFCKEHVYGDVAALAQRLGIDLVADGMNLDDTLDVRPGRAAALRRGVRSPLNELGFSKDDVRLAARLLGLPNWDKPAAACLASRIAYGTPVSDELLARVERAEEWLRQFGFDDLRVRHHGGVARIEVPAHELGRLVAMGEELAAGIRALGWDYVTVDLQGMQHGSMNRPLLNTGA